MRQSLLSLAVAGIVLSGCTMIPDYQRPEAPVAQAWPQGQAYEGSAAQGSVPAPDLGWRDFLRDPALQRLVVSL